MTAGVLNVTYNETDSEPEAIVTCPDSTELEVSPAGSPPSAKRACSCSCPSSTPRSSSSGSTRNHDHRSSSASSSAAVSPRCRAARRCRALVPPQTPTAFRPSVSAASKHSYWTSQRPQYDRGSSSDSPRSGKNTSGSTPAHACGLPDAPLGSGRSAGCTTEVVREADADKARAGALGGPKPDLRPLASGCVSALDAGGERPGRVECLPPPSSPVAESRSQLGGRRGLPRELSILSAQNTPSGQAPTVRRMRDESGS